MPLFNFECQHCDQVFEALVSRSEATAATCPHCDRESPRQAISRFSVGGRRQSAGKGALRARGSDLMSNSDRFVSAMDAFGDAIGDRLTDRQMERAVTRLQGMKR